MPRGRVCTSSAHGQNEVLRKGLSSKLVRFSPLNLEEKKKADNRSEPENLKYMPEYSPDRSLKKYQVRVLVMFFLVNFFFFVFLNTGIKSSVYVYIRKTAILVSKMFGLYPIGDRGSLVLSGIAATDEGFELIVKPPLPLLHLLAKVSPLARTESLFTISRWPDNGRAWVHLLLILYLFFMSSKDARKKKN